MPTDIENIINAAHDPEVSALIAARAVAGEIHARYAAPVRFDESLPITIHAAQHARPWLANDQQTASVRALLIAGIVNDCGVDTKHWDRATSWHGWRGARQWGNDMSARFSLPHRVNNRASTATNDLVVPHPRFRIDRLAHGSQDPKAGKVVLGRMHIAPAHEAANGGWRCVKVRDVVARNDPPESILGWEIRGTFVHERWYAVGQHSIHDVTVTGDPTDVSGAEIHLLVPWHQIECPARGRRGEHHVSTGGVQDSFGLTSTSRCVQEEQWMLTINGLTRAGGWLRWHQVMPPHIALWMHRHFVVGPLEY